MSDKVLACRIEGDDVYFIKRPKPGEQNGFIRKEFGDRPIDFWSFISRFPDMEIIDNTDYLKEMWFGDTQSREWAQEYLHHGRDPSESADKTS